MRIRHDRTDYFGHHRELWSILLLGRILRRKGDAMNRLIDIGLRMIVGTFLFLVPLSILVGFMVFFKEGFLIFFVGIILAIVIYCIGDIGLEIINEKRGDYHTSGIPIPECTTRAS